MSTVEYRPGEFLSGFPESFQFCSTLEAIESKLFGAAIPHQVNILEAVGISPVA